MRSYSALYIDAGYLLAAAATRATGSSLRAGINVDYQQLLNHLISVAQQRSGIPLLRINWYDAARDGMTATQTSIAALPKVKVRLGRVGVDGEQKGVDLRIGLDLVTHARNGAIDAMFLVSGDDDLTEAVEEAQAQGVQVTVLAIPNLAGTPQGVSRHLTFAADDVDIIDAATVDETVRSAKPRPPREPGPSTLTDSATSGVMPTPGDVAGRVTSTPLTASTTDAPVVDEAVTETIRSATRRTYDAWLATATDDARSDLLAGRPSIPRDLDRALLVDVSDALHIDILSDPLRVRLRAEFWTAFDTNTVSR